MGWPIRTVLRWLHPGQVIHGQLRHSRAIQTQQLTQHAYFWTARGNPHVHRDDYSNRSQSSSKSNSTTGVCNVPLWLFQVYTRLDRTQFPKHESLHHTGRQICVTHINAPLSDGDKRIPEKKPTTKQLQQKRSFLSHFNTLFPLTVLSLFGFLTGPGMNSIPHEQLPWLANCYLPLAIHRCISNLGSDSPLPCANYWTA